MIKLFFMLFCTLPSYTKQTQRGYPTCYILCKTGNYLIYCLLVMHVLKCAEKQYIFWHEFIKTGALYKSKMLLQLIYHAANYCWHIPQDLLNIAAAYALFSISIYFSNPYETTKSNKI